MSIARRGRAAIAAVLACALVGAGVMASQARGTGAVRGNTPPAYAPQQVARFLRDHTAVSSPGDHGSVVQVVREHRPITGERTTLPVIGHAVGSRGVSWLRVLLPGRPNGRTGWIKEQGTALAVTPWRLLVSLRARRVSVYRNGVLTRSFSAVVGKPSTPTPTGEFFVEESVALPPGDVGAPFALALSARSKVLQEFAGGPGQIAIHGLMNVGGVLGTAASHGCVRLANAAVRWLAARIGPGVPVTIR